MRRLSPASVIGQSLSSGIDVGWGLAVSAERLDTSPCYGLHFTLDFAIPLLNR